MKDFRNENKRIIKNSIFLYARMIIIMIVSLYTSRVILSALGVEDFGIYNVVGGIVSLFAFINGAMSQTSQRYIAYELGSTDGGNVTRAFSTAVVLHILIAIFVFIMAETIGLYILNNFLTIPDDRLYAANWVYQFSILSCIVMIISTPFNGAIIAYEHMKAFAYVSLVDTLFRLAIALVISFSNVDNLILYAALLFLLQAIIRVGYSVYCRFYLPEIKFKFIYDRTVFKSMFSFTSWTLFNNLSIIACTQGINLLLNFFFSPLVNAARGIAMQVELAISTFSKNFQVALNPQIIKSYSSNDNERFISLIYSSSKYSFFLLMILASPIVFETNAILRVWLTEVPDYTANFIQIIIMVSLVNILIDPLTTGVSSTGLIKFFQIISGVILMSVIPISYCIFKFYQEPIWVFIVYLILSIIVYLFKLVYASIHLNFKLIEYFNNILFRICLTTFVNYFICSYVKSLLNIDSFTKLVLACFYYIVVSLVIVFIVGLNRYERTKILCFIKKKAGFIK